MSNGTQGQTGCVFNIQRYSLHDGPGIRTTVFLKGCPLRCLWCCNPESQSLEPQILFADERCIRCGACIEACLEGAIVVGADGTRRVEAEKCTLCGACIEGCYAGALEQVGRLMTVREVMAEVEADIPFYDQSGGGVTLSGGEPTTQGDFGLRLLQGCKALAIHTAIESCGHVAWSTWEAMLPHLDLILYDLKETDPERHRRWTGASNELVLENLRRLATSGKEVIVRRPVIPGYNDGVEMIHDLGRFARELGTVEEIDLLPYHRLGQGKYERLGQAHALGDQPSLERRDVSGLREILLSYGFRVKIGG
jgi:pyruvate formate lyase activating enzyme